MRSLKMKIRYGWNPQYSNPNYWCTRTALYKDMPKIFHLYQDLNDNKLRVFLKELKGKILDAGCGNGRFLSYADVGIDFSKGMLQRAKSRQRAKSLVLASILYIPFKDKAFSVAFTADILLHIEPNRRKDVIRELDRVANNSYNFLAEHRTITPFILELLKTIHLKPQRIWLSYIALLLAFPFDRLRKLKIDSSSQVLRKLG